MGSTERVRLAKKVISSLCLFLLSRMKFITKAASHLLLFGWQVKRIYIAKKENQASFSQVLCFSAGGLLKFLLHMEVERDRVAQSGLPA